ncbi:AAA family ATPase [Halapricum desulfuricans]|uniref:GTPase subunit of restriction endonuclease n=1 Tax=Halapricum desulfuricans TaxID=2841257 RepID=A0A897NP96_9EURY|nr:AAA family ATPase [Halapricum desulfuricans]QSG16340.1 GTPase subunit of restriction endonuclease [Halapricum desulfuricans]
MSSSSGEYTEDDAKEDLNVLKEVPNKVVDAIDNATDEGVLDFLIREQQLDTVHDGERGIGQVRRAVLKSSVASKDLKRLVITRNDNTPRDVLVPDDVYRNAKTALKAGKPVVLYGPTGTGKTTFAKQLALEESIGYSLNTATPSWTAKDIIGGIGPKLSGHRLNYQTELGCVSEAIKRSKDFAIDYTVILDEITRADISKIFGPLYTAIENPQQELIETDDGEPITLNDDVNLICTMNMSDRTVNELDNAITRRFAMIEVDEYSDESRRELFEKFIDDHIEQVSDGGSPVFDESDLLELFEIDYKGINEGNDQTSQGPIMRFGPMHYEDIARFLGEATSDPDLYLDNPGEAVGQAFRTYIVPRLLNSAAFPQIERIENHYRALNDQFEEYNLKPAADLAKRELESEQRQMGSYEQ